MSESDLAIMAALVFAWGTLSARLERFDVTAPIIFVLAGVLLTHGPLAVLSVTRRLSWSRAWRRRPWCWCCFPTPRGWGCGS